jgi:precorrin-2 dehydrogenase / sirohydrochlorin ferrochelatase
MKYYPVNLNITNRNCLVAGGGRVASRKVQTLLSCGANVTVVSPEVCDAIAELGLAGRIRLVRRDWQDSDLDGQFMVIGATSDMAVNRRISAAAEQRNMLCNIADVPEICNFILPAVVRRGDLIVAVSTSGKSPAFAKKLRKDLEVAFGEEYARFLALMGAIRKRLLCEQHDPEEHKDLFEALIDRGLLAMVRENRHADIDRLLADLLGDGYACEGLMDREEVDEDAAKPAAAGPDNGDGS